MIKKYLLAILAISLLVMSACDAKLDMNIEEFKEQVIKANSEVQTYNFEMTSDVVMNLEFLGQKVESTMDMTYSGAVDRINNKVKLISTSKVDMLGTVETIEMEMYLEDNYTYIYMMNNWMKVPTEYDYFGEQDQINLTTDLMDSGTIIYEGEDNIEGKNYYVVTLKPDLNKLVEIALSTLGMDELMGDVGNFEDIIKEYETKLWINKENFIIERTQEYLVMSMDGIEGGEGSMDFIVNSQTIMKNINEPVNIQVPQEALNAQSTPMFI